MSVQVNGRRLVTLALLAAGFAFLFRDVMVKLVHDWGADENYSHGFLVVPLVLYILWRERATLLSGPSRPSAAGLVLIAGSIATLAAGRLGAELYLTRLAMLGTLAGIVVFLWGFRRLWQMMFLLLLLFLAIPIPAIIFNQIAFPLQLLASRFGETAIAACGIPVLREGNVIVLATTTLEVADACSGIRSLVSLLTLALVWGYFSGSATWLRWLLALASVPIAIFSNAIRVAGTGVAAHFIGPEAAEGFLHTFSGWMVFVVAGVLMLAVHRVAVWLAPRKAFVASEANTSTSPDDSRPAGDDKSLLIRGAVAAALLGVAAVSLGAMTRTEVIGPREPLAALPLSLGDWRGRDEGPLDARVLEILGADEYLIRGYLRPGGPFLSLYVGYYNTQRQGQTIHSPLNCLPGAGWEPTSRKRITLPAEADDRSGKRPAEINRLVIQKGIDRQLVLYWYQAHGRIVASEYWGKIYTVLDAIRLNRSDGSMVRVIVPIASADAGAEQAAERVALEFVRTLLPALSKHLDG